MITTIETLKKLNGNHVLPRTSAKAVSLENGTTVEAAIGNINAAIDDINTEVENLATETYVDNKVAALVNSAPDKLNTLDELAAALGDDENFANTVTSSLSNKLEKSELNTAINIALEQAKESGEFDGAPGVSGVYVGSGEMPDGYNVQIDPNGSATDIINLVIDALPKYNGEVAAG